MDLTIRVVPRAAKPGITVDADGTLKVRLQSPPVDGAANDELVQVLATAFDVSRRAVTITGGVYARTKRVRIDGVDDRQFAAVTAASAAPPPRRREPRTPRR